MSNSHSAGQSNVGAPNIYNDGDQKHISLAEVDRVSKESGHNLRGHMGNYSGTFVAMGRWGR